MTGWFARYRARRAARKLRHIIGEPVLRVSHYAYAAVPLRVAVLPALVDATEAVNELWEHRDDGLRIALTEAIDPVLKVNDGDAEVIAMPYRHIAVVMGRLNQGVADELLSQYKRDYGLLASFLGSYRVMAFQGKLDANAVTAWFGRGIYIPDGDDQPVALVMVTGLNGEQHPVYMDMPKSTMAGGLYADQDGIIISNPAWTDKDMARPELFRPALAVSQAYPPDWPPFFFGRLHAYDQLTDATPTAGNPITAEGGGRFQISDTNPAGRRLRYNERYISVGILSLAGGVPPDSVEIIGQPNGDPGIELLVEALNLPDLADGKWDGIREWWLNVTEENTPSFGNYEGAAHWVYHSSGFLARFRREHSRYDSPADLPLAPGQAINVGPYVITAGTDAKGRRIIRAKPENALLGRVPLDRTEWIDFGKTRVPGVALSRWDLNHMERRPSGSGLSEEELALPLRWFTTLQRFDGLARVVPQIAADIRDAVRREGLARWGLDQRAVYVDLLDTGRPILRVASGKSAFIRRDGIWVEVMAGAVDETSAVLREGDTVHIGPFELRVASSRDLP